MTALALPRLTISGRESESHGTSTPDPGGHVAVSEKKAMHTYAMLEAREYTRNRPRDLAAFDAMCAARPLKPPPYRFGPRRSNAAAIAVREDRRAGVLV